MKLIIKIAKNDICEINCRKINEYVDLNIFEIVLEDNTVVNVKYSNVDWYILNPKNQLTIPIKKISNINDWVRHMY